MKIIKIGAKTPDVVFTSTVKIEQRLDVDKLVMSYFIKNADGTTYAEKKSTECSSALSFVIDMLKEIKFSFSNKLEIYVDDDAFYIIVTDAKEKAIPATEFVAMVIEQEYMCS